TVTIKGVVIAAYNDLNGFFMQEEDADVDADPTTSEGIFVFLNADPTVEEGDIVQVTGAVDEFFGMTQIDNDNNNLSVIVVDNGNNLNLVTPTTLNLPIPAGQDIDDFYEQYEGMRVKFQDKMVVSEYFELARFGQVVLTENSRPFQYTHTDNTPTVAEFNAFKDELARRTIILDDENNIQNAPLPNGVFFHPQPNGFGIGTQGTNFFRGGDTVNNLIGVLHWSFAGFSGTDAWRIRPTEANPVQFTVENPRPAMPANIGGNVTVASFNVLNYFTTIDNGNSGDARGADSQDELTRQTDKLVEALVKIRADIFGLVEIENNDDAALVALTNALNDDENIGAGTYLPVLTGTVGDDAITVALLYDKNVVAPKGEPAILDDPSFTDPNNTGEQRSRPAIAVTFEVIGNNNPDFGAVFTVVVNHLKSKGASGITSGPDFDQGDGQGNWNDTRTKGAQALAQWLATDPSNSNDPDFMIIGDLNAYKGETPITALKNAGYNDLVEQFGGSNAYTYVFDGQLGYLDYAMSNSALTPQVTGVTQWHINADEVPVFDYNNNVDDGGGEQSFEAKPTGNPLYEANAFRTSDHDPIIIGLNLTVPCNIVTHNINKVNPTNCGVNNGSITISASGTLLEYSINGGDSFQESNVFTGLGAGSYDIVVRQTINSHCEASQTVTLTAPAAPVSQQHRYRM
ncbi:MAG: ExeM/NucH family extracellular endonuclease, partial [Bacteroidia bacterium]|nr:ExeM/NucH family extracellular endonuclease [Bacteroidia bacterium]